MTPRVFVFVLKLHIYTKIFFKVTLTFSLRNGWRVASARNSSVVYNSIIIKTNKHFFQFKKAINV